MDLSIEIRTLTFEEEPGAVPVPPRGMRDNPLHARAFDPDGSAACLENDKAGNLSLLEWFAFQVKDEHEGLGVRNWFMLRAAKE